MAPGISQDRVQAFLARGLVKIHGSIQHAVVGNGYCRKFQLVRLVHQPVQTARPIEQRILGVQVQVDKFGVRHI